MKAEIKKQIDEIFKILHEEFEVAKLAEELAGKSELVKRYKRTLSYIVQELEVLCVKINLAKEVEQ